MLQVKLNGQLDSVQDILAMARFEDGVFKGEALTARARLALLALDEENVALESVVLSVSPSQNSALFLKNSIAFWDKYGAVVLKAFRQEHEDVALVDPRWAGIWNLLALTKDTPAEALAPLVENMPHFQNGEVSLTLKGLKIKEVMMVLDFLEASVRHCEAKSVRFGQSKEAENEAFMFRTLCNTIGLSGAEYAELRKWGLQVLEGDSAWRFGNEKANSAG